MAGWLRDAECEMVVVGESPFLIDPDRRCTMHVIANPDAVCEDVVKVVARSAAAPAWLGGWVAAEQSSRKVIASLLDDEAALSEPGVARTVAAALPRGASLMVSSSMPVRDLEWYAGATDHLRVLANRGANGIDGVVSSAVGVALASGAPTDGGGIFSFLPQRNTLATDRFEQLFGTPHGTDLAALANAHGLAVESVSTTAQLRASLVAQGPRVIVVRTNRDRNVQQHDDLHAAVARALDGA
ncbi:MAG: hypothetical protein EBT73_07270 [Actinobacteria bacterium]|nr:hypothetical protein [Actinomycetota bacterium]